jgi:phosphoenolpyruvate carboxykinase (ATP)
MLEQGIRNPEYGVDKFGFTDLEAVNWNLLEPELYERALTGGEAQLTSGGALCAETGVHTGRSPKDKYIVCDDLTDETVWWENNGKMTPAQFARLYQDFIAHSCGKTLYAQDLRAGADAEFGVRTRVFTQLAWHSLFIRTLLLRPNRSELATFVPELTIYCCPTFKADPKRHGVRSDTVIAIDFTKKIVLIGGSRMPARSRRPSSRP